MDKQFTKEEVADKVLEQYDEEITRVFYQCVMGGGGHDIHFGIYKNPEDGVKESSAYTTEWMMTQMDWAKTIKPDMHVLDLGSGHGGGSHAMAKRFGCKVTGYNLGPGQNALNMERCVELGIDHLVDAQVGNINEPPPRGVDEQVRRGVVVRGAVPRRRQGGAVQGAGALPEAGRRVRVLGHHGRGRRGREGAEGLHRPQRDDVHGPPLDVHRLH